MENLKYSLPLLPFLLCLFPSTQALSEQVLSTFIYTQHGERTPMVWNDLPTLTPLGAQQVWQAGANMRERYVQPTGLTDQTFTVRDIQSVFLSNSEISILTNTDPWVIASATAFMQGLYPPLTDGQNYTIIEGISDLANGTNIVAPLGGYQYADVAAASPYDLRSIYVNGADNCPQYNLAMIEYYNSSEYLVAQQDSQQFYDSIENSVLNGVFATSADGYFDAYYIWDYLSYAYVHNITVARHLSNEDYVTAKVLAADWMFDMYANSTNGEVGSATIRAIAGRTLAFYILEAFTYSIQTNGEYNKISLAFGDYKPMMSFAALVGLMTERTGAFFNPPAPGASLIFELFTFEPESTYPNYPQTTDMYVRFLYSNGTDSDSSLIEYPLFGLSPSEAIMTWADFLTAMSSIMIENVGDWCQTCDSSSVFCSGYTETTEPSSTGQHGLNPAIAGVIGAIAALAFIALVVILVMVLGGVRLHRRTKRTSQLGGFKGTEKLASDQDLTIPKGSVGITVNEEPRGHERVGSWELREPANVSGAPSGIDTEALRHGKHGLDHDDTAVDPYAIPVKARDAF